MQSYRKTTRLHRRERGWNYARCRRKGRLHLDSHRPSPFGRSRPGTMLALLPRGSAPASAAVRSSIRGGLTEPGSKANLRSCCGSVTPSEASSIQVMAERRARQSRSPLWKEGPTPQATPQRPRETQFRKTLEEARRRLLFRQPTASRSPPWLRKTPAPQAFSRAAPAPSTERRLTGIDADHLACEPPATHPRFSISIRKLTKSQCRVQYVSRPTTVRPKRIRASASS